MMKKLFLIIFSLFFALQLSAQLKAKLAAKHFDNLAYFEAAPIYNELADKFISKKKGEREYVLRAAIANGKIAQFKRSNTYYASLDRKSTRLNSSHVRISYAVFCLKKKKK